MQENYQLTETEKALQVAQMLVEQGNVAAAEPIFKGILADSGPLTLEGALCLSNLAMILESRGDIRGAVDYNLRLLNRAQDNRPIPHALKVAHARRAAQLLALLGRIDESDRLTSEANQPPADSAASGLVPAQPEPDAAWLLHSLQETAFRVAKKEQGDNGAGLPSGAEGKATESVPKRRAAPDKSSSTNAPLLKPGNRGRRLNRSRKKGDLRDALTGWIGKIAGGGPAFNYERPRAQPEGGASPPQVVKGGARRRKAQGEAPRSGAGEPGRSQPRQRSSRGKDFRPVGGLEPSLFEKLAGLFPSPGPQGVSQAKYSEPQALVDREKTKLSGFWNNICLLAAAVIIFVAAWIVAPRSGSAFMHWSHSPHEFIDARQDKQIWLVSPQDCELVAGSTRERVKLQYYFGDWRELLTLAFGRLVDKYGYIQEAKKGLVDQDGTLLYDAHGPEARLAQRVQEMAADVDDYYADRGRYPKKVSDLKEISWKYTNPYSKQPDVPAITSESFGSDKSDAGADADTARTDMYDTLSSGEFWQKIKVKAGSISCYNVSFNSTRGTIYGFVIAAFDGNGKALAGATPESCFYLASEDGKPRRANRPVLHHCSAIWLLLQPIDRQSRFVLEHAGCFVFALAALMSLAVALSRGRKDKSKPLWFIGVTLAALLSVLYFVSSHLR